MPFLDGGCEVERGLGEDESVSESYLQTVSKRLSLRVSYVAVYLARRQGEVGDEDPELEQGGEQEGAGGQHGGDDLTPRYCATYGKKTLGICVRLGSTSATMPTQDVMLGEGN